ncbi:MAG: hypothetical protein GY821_02155 [Gammaproteobacteria bacterium]|nr:hypothetical protein [Gammaproteobacteria bacterium]
MELRRYYYVAYQDGKRFSHYLKASNEIEAVKILKQHNIVPVKLWRKRKILVRLQQFLARVTFRHRYSGSLKATLCYDLYHQMLASDSTTQAISDVIDSMPDKRIKAKLTELLALLNDGHNLGESISRTLDFLDVNAKLMSSIKSKSAILEVFKFLSNKYQSRSSHGAIMFLSIFITCGLIVIAIFSGNFIANRYMESIFTDIWLLGRDNPPVSVFFYNLFGGNIAVGMATLVISIFLFIIFHKLLLRIRYIRYIEQYIFLYLPIYQRVQRMVFYLDILEAMRFSLLSGESLHQTLSSFFLTLRSTCLRRRADKALFFLQSGRGIAISLEQLGMIDRSKCHQLENILTRPNPIEEMGHYISLIEKKLNFQQVIFRSSVQLLLIFTLFAIIGFISYSVTEASSVLMMGM